MQPDERGFYGEFGGAFIPEMLYPNVHELQESYRHILNSQSFQQEYKRLLKDYVGRPSPLFHASHLSEQYKVNIYLKREDCNHTGSHKINNALGQILLAKQLGKKRIIAETGAGQHGVATATACALMGMECIVFMGNVDIERQAQNVKRMEMLGATVHAVKRGSMTLKDAVNEALRDWINHPKETYYLVGSAIGPHPFPDLVARLQAVISDEIRAQLFEQTGNHFPDYVLACIGGGSNAVGAFYHFFDNPHVRLVAVEAAGKGIDTSKHASSLLKGTKGILHGTMTMLMQSSEGQIIEPYSVSAGLDYPGVGPIHAYFAQKKRIKVLAATDEEALEAAFLLTKTEGIIPAIESAHALAALNKINFSEGQTVVINLSGRGDKDMETYLRHIDQK